MIENVFRVIDFLTEAYMTPPLSEFPVNMWLAMKCSAVIFCIIHLSPQLDCLPFKVRCSLRLPLQVPQGSHQCWTQR